MGGQPESVKTLNSLFAKTPQKLGTTFAPLPVALACSSETSHAGDQCDYRWRKDGSGEESPRE
jgi:hypothetical protein